MPHPLPFELQLAVRCRVPALKIPHRCGNAASWLRGYGFRGFVSSSGHLKSSSCCTTVFQTTANRDRHMNASKGILYSVRVNSLSLTSRFNISAACIRKARPLQSHTYSIIGRSGTPMALPPELRYVDASTLLNPSIACPSAMGDLRRNTNRDLDRHQPDR